MPAPSLTKLGALNVAVGATLLMVTVALYSLTPPSVSAMRPLTVRVPLSLVGHVVVLDAESAPYPLPVPQSNAYVNPAAVSADDGSNGAVNESAMSAPSLTELGVL